MLSIFFFLFFFFNDTATTEIYTLSLHDALPIYGAGCAAAERTQTAVRKMTAARHRNGCMDPAIMRRRRRDRKSTRLNSSHGYISYAVFCLKKKKQRKHQACQLTYHKNRDSTTPC